MSSPTPQRWTLSPEEAEQLGQAMAQANAAVENVLKAFAEQLVPAMKAAADQLNEYAAAMRAATPPAANVARSAGARKLVEEINRAAAGQRRTDGRGA